MKKLYTLVAMLLAVTALRPTANAQAPNLTYVNNFTTTDYYGNPFDLYSFLDAGYTVIIDISAVWCGPCWSMHQSQLLKNIWAAHGPAGAPGVNANTTDDVIVVYLEGDHTTSSTLLAGGSGSQGDWVTGTPYFIIDDNATTNIKAQFSICGYPNTFIICPNRLIKKSYCGYGANAMTVSALYGEVGGCPVATMTNDAYLVNYTGTVATCDDVTVKARIQNLGLSPLTSATITATGGNTPLSYNWSGNLDTYQVQEVTLGTTSISSNSTITVSITTPDGNSANNTVTQQVQKAKEGNNYIEVQIATDRWGDETKWKLKNSNGATVLAGGPYTVQSANGVYQQPTQGISVPLDCYEFEVTDTYGDGMCCGYGAGYYKVIDNTGFIYAQGGEFEYIEKTPLEAVSITGVEETLAQASGMINIALFPVPVSDEATLTIAMKNAADVTYVITDVLGKEMARVEGMRVAQGVHKIGINVSDLANGVYFINVSDGGNAATLKFTVAK